MLQNPAWPLCNMGAMIYFTGPYQRVADMLPDMPEALEVASITYRMPAKILTNFIDILNIFETFKTDEWSNPTSNTPKNNAPESAHPNHSPIKVVDTSGNRVDAFEAAMARAKHNIIDRELESINSLLCSPCNCTLCCVGPDWEAIQDFFEIPLMDMERHLFELPSVDSEQTRKTDPYSDPPILINKKPFYHNPTALYRWSEGWSMILTRGSTCPALSVNGTCTIYADRPQVCRKPQIFSDVLERTGHNEYILRNSLLAVLDCPYVRYLKDEITAYASMCETDIVFKENKE